MPHCRYEHLLKTDADVNELAVVKRDYPRLMFESMLRRYGQAGWRVVQCSPPTTGVMQPEWWVLFEKEVE